MTFAGRMGGGVFSPALMLGALTGCAFGELAIEIFPSISGSQGLYALAGMGAVWVWRRRGLAPLRGGVTAGLVFLGLGLVFRVTMTSFSSGGHWGPRM